MWISSLCNGIPWGESPFPIVCSWHLCQKSIDHKFVRLFLVFYSSTLLGVCMCILKTQSTLQYILVIWESYRLHAILEKAKLWRQWLSRLEKGRDEQMHRIQKILRAVRLCNYIFYITKYAYYIFYQIHSSKSESKHKLHILVDNAV